MRGVLKKSTIALLILLMIIGISGCRADKNLSQEENQGAEVVVIEDPQEDKDKEMNEETQKLEGFEINPLTGLYIDEEVAKRRPVAIMINNLKKAIPQSGISQADVIYETLAEGNITRLLAVFQDFDAEKIGPVRSARHYYIDLAFNHDAIYIHYGGSPQAYAAASDWRSDNLNGLSYLDEIMCWRDPVRKKQKGMYEHSVYTNAEKIMKAWDVVKYRKEAKGEAQGMFVFSEEERQMEGKKAEKVALPFTSKITTNFEYDPGSGLYKRIQFNQPHIDEMNNQQLMTKNIIVQYTEIKHIAGDKAGRRDVKTIGEGKGMYITNGTAVPISWSKANHQAPTIYKDENGNHLEMNKGKTWIIIFPSNRQIKLQ
ncbi:DUF3048 domain-containing protein [Alkaliphilus hydrothermalis]|uniref:Lipoprotein YerB n=1 Tax=Alkaliphilus hydrothermalis TaxID=1482730 RepID=A0ABS2NPA2_9FIRM|nr:DUF3048 domain-containing protein [Alkaliphilus hydrothermalis]MBM7614642.1 hypothetical protein [Alkaliphilus hydrothermalis]